jgi:hypothetical protein
MTPLGSTAPWSLRWPVRHTNGSTGGTSSSGDPPARRRPGTEALDVATNEVSGRLDELESNERSWLFPSLDTVSRLREHLDLVAELRTAAEPDVAMLTVAVQELRTLAESAERD